MKTLTLQSLCAAIFLPGLLLSSDPVHQKVIAAVLFFFHVGLVLFTWGNYDTDAKEVAGKNKGELWTIACYASGIIAFISAISAINEPWSLSNVI